MYHPQFQEPVDLGSFSFSLMFSFQTIKRPNTKEEITPDYGEEIILTKGSKGQVMLDSRGETNVIWLPGCSMKITEYSNGSIYCRSKIQSVL